MQQPADAERVDGLLRHALVVTEDHPLEHLRHGRAHAGEQVRARGQAQPVDEPLQPAAAAGDGQVGEVRLEQHVLPAAAQVAPVVELARLGLGSPSKLTEGRLSSAPSVSGPVGTVAQRHPLLEHQAQVRRLVDGRTVDAGDADGERDLAVLLGREVRQDGGDRLVMPDVLCQRGPGDGVEPGAADRGARGEEEQRERRGDREGAAPGRPGRPLRLRPGARRDDQRRRPPAAAATSSAPGAGRHASTRHRPAQYAPSST